MPIIGFACLNIGMLTGTDLGQALRVAMEKKHVTQQAVADAFDVTQPSVHEWLKHGRIHKEHLGKLITWFADVVGPEHWGFPISWTSADAASPYSEDAATIAGWFDALPQDKRNRAFVANYNMMVRDKWADPAAFVKPAAVAPPRTTIPNAETNDPPTTPTT